MSMTGRIAVITGAAGGIGSETALMLGRNGARLLLVDLARDRLAETAETLRSQGIEAEIKVADVTVSADVQAYVAFARERFGRIDAFFNNAGIEGAVAPTAEYPEDVFDKVIAVNLKGVFLGLRHVLPVMIAQKSGAIVNTASIAGERGLPGTCAYNASKHAVVGLTRTAATEAGPAGVRVNTVEPGMIDTRMLRSLVNTIFDGDTATGFETVGKAASLGRCAQPAEVAAVVAFLLSDAASFVNGAAWSVDGGALAGLGNGA